MKQHIRTKDSFKFVEYDSPTKCNKCFFMDNEKQCKMHKCNPTERKDGKNGYYRKLNAPATAGFISPFNGIKLPTE